MYLTHTNIYTFTRIKSNHMDGPLGHKNLILSNWLRISQNLSSSSSIQITYSVAKDIDHNSFFELVDHTIFTTKYIYKGIHQSFFEIGFRYKFIAVTALMNPSWVFGSSEICQS